MPRSAIPTESESASASSFRSIRQDVRASSVKSRSPAVAGPVRSALALDTPIQFVKGVGPVRAKLFERLGVRNVGELIELLPFRYECRPKSQAIGSLQLAQTATIIGEVRGLRSRGRFAGRTINIEVVDGTGVAQVRWFHSPFIADKLHNGCIVRLTGKVDQYGQRASMTNPQTTVIDRAAGDPLANERDEFEPVYPATEGLTSRDVARAVGLVLDGAIEQVPELIPERLRTVRRMPPRRTAIVRLHRPTSAADAEIARRRLAYDELLVFQLAVQFSRNRQKSAAAPIITLNEKTDDRIRRRLPFALTPGQNKAVEEIKADLARPAPMNRLLQADVGAGKTAVAVYASLAVVAAKGQVALLAPTEVLAAQHQAKIERYLHGSRVRLGFLTGSTAKRERAVLLRKLAHREIDWLIGTHAILEPDVRFAQLSLVIVDEQHKFGVAQRAKLLQKGPSPHTLFLTATPIPRSLAMTLFGDLDISTVHDRPPGRQPVVTRLVTADKVEPAWNFIRKRLSAGEQAYVVYPLVEESEAMPLKAASVEVERLSREVLAGSSVALLHGRMPSGDKAAVLGRFRSGELRVLVSTTVVEVGLDVPDATMMLIQHADRYGLSQLHQLRGRIGRGNRKSFCFLFADPKGESALSRLSILCRTDDGFQIAEEDLRLRGPGELLGTRQHGVPMFRVADLARDLSLLQDCRDDAAEILRQDRTLKAAENASLRSAVMQRFGRSLRLMKVG